MGSVLQNCEMYLGPFPHFPFPSPTALRYGPDREDLTPNELDADHLASTLTETFCFALRRSILAAV